MSNIVQAQTNKSFEAKRLDLLLVNPSCNWKRDQQTKISMRVNKDIPNQETPHIGIAYLLGVAKREGLKARYIDMAMDAFSVEDLIDYIAKAKPRLIGFTAFTIQIKTAGRLADMIKQKFNHIKICVGGPHASAIPQDTLEEFSSFDFIVCGEGEDLIWRIFEVLENEEKLARLPGVVTRRKNNFTWSPIKNLDDLPYPAWEEFDLSKYPGTYPHRTQLELPMISSRGCPFRCVFCCRALGGALRHRSVQSVIREIEYNIEKFNCQSIAFMDETFMSDKKWSGDFFKIIIARGLNKKITWSCSARVSDVYPEIISRMKEAGCYYIFYGMESADDITLRRIKKYITVGQIKNAVKWTKQAGIVPVGAFIIGLPGDTEKHVIKDIELSEELDLYSVTFPIAIPFPGTELRRGALKNEFGMQVISNNWDYYGKQDGGVMESNDLSWRKMKELQQIAYMRNPKKDFNIYVERLHTLFCNKK